MSSVTSVLVVEDDEDDFFLTERVLRRLTPCRILRVDNGRAAVDYLAGQASFADRTVFPFPDVVLLDLKMHQMSGHEVLAAVREAPPHPMPKIIVLTGSNEPKDRDMVESSGVAAGYLVKPLSAEHVRAIFGLSAGSAPRRAGL